MWSVYKDAIICILYLHSVHPAHIHVTMGDDKHLEGISRMRGDNSPIAEQEGK